MFDIVFIALLATSSAIPVTHCAPNQALTIRQVGAMVLSGFGGTASNSPGVVRVRELAERGAIGGVIISTHNVESPEQLRRLVQSMHAWNTPEPLLVAIDQEGGAVQRLRASHGFTAWPSAWDVAQMPLSDARYIYGELARELASYGINLNFGPVVDVHADDAPAIGMRRRIFSADPAQIEAYAQVFVEAHRAWGIKTVLKHFPGHGSARTDSHLGFTDTTGRWSTQELVPFAQLIRSGFADAVMTAHVVNTELEPSGTPLTFSRAVINENLRDAMAFNGVVISDDLKMGALSQHYELPYVIEHAVAAGHDILLFSQNAAADGKSAAAFAEIPGLTDIVSDAVCHGINAGSINADAIAKSYARIMAFKKNIRTH